jgi:ABC-2 type transport system ATP-binding protein
MIKVENLSLCYRMPAERVSGLKEYIVAALRGKMKYKEFWALNDLSFEVKKGEVLGIIGRNGAGKSTLLKVISGILKPTSGSIIVEGNVAPMLELGSGFDYELTGRENIFLNGAILGYSEAFLKEKYDEIVAFSELEDFIEVPLRNYSSGMVMRLAFSIATVVKPDVLIADEILAVGDAEFQAKSGKRMKELMSGGTTVLLVSHSISKIRELCDHVLWIEKGCIQLFGTGDIVCDAYEGKIGFEGNVSCDGSDFSEYEDQLTEWYKVATGKALDLSNPQTYNEKIQWLKLYDSSLMKTKLTDKYLVREWIEEKVGDEYLVPLLGVWDSFDEIDFLKLPDQFVLKCNHGSGWNMIVKDKSTFDIACAKSKFDQWMAMNYAFVTGFEMHYLNIKPKIIAEKFLEEWSDKEICDYKILCFSGKPEYIWIDTGRFTKHRRDFFDRQWNHLPIRYEYDPADIIPEKPELLEGMFQLAEKLSCGFCHTRINFRAVSGKLYVEEITFATGSGIGLFMPEECVLELGRMIQLPEIRGKK